MGAFLPQPPEGARGKNQAAPGSAIAPLLRSGGFDKLNHRRYATLRALRILCASKLARGSFFKISLIFTRTISMTGPGYFFIITKIVINKSI